MMIMNIKLGSKSHLTQFFGRNCFKAIARLPQKQKSVFCLRYFDDLSYEDISEILGTSVGALKASYHFASEKIRAELQNQIKP